MAHTLFLASKSPSRKMLLEQSCIPFITIDQYADEEQCTQHKQLASLVQAIAVYKMEHVVLPLGNTEGEYCFVLTADTLSQDLKSGSILGKPYDRADAVYKIKQARGGSRAGTAFCLHKYVWHNNIWSLIFSKHKYVQVDYVFFIPDHLIDWYLDNSIGMHVAGAVAVEGFGAQFLKSINGSYSGLVGLPLFEVREALTECGFFSEQD